MHSSSARIVAIVLLSLISIGSACGYSYVSSAHAQINQNQSPSIDASTTPSPPQTNTTPTPTVDRNVYPISANTLSSPLFSLSQHVGGSGDDEILEVINAGQDTFVIGVSNSPDKDVCANYQTVFLTKLTTLNLTKTTAICVNRDEDIGYLGSKLIQDGIVIITTNSNGITIHKYSYNLVYLNSTAIPLQSPLSADTYLVENDMYLIVENVEGIHLITFDQSLDVDYCRLVVSDGTLASSLLTANGLLLISNHQNSIRMTSIGYDSNVISTSYIHSQSISAIDLCPSLDSSVGANMLLYSLDGALRIRLLDISLNCVYDKDVGSGNSGTIIPLARGYLVVSYDTQTSTLVCKHGDILKENVGIKFDNHVVYYQKSNHLILLGTHKEEVFIYGYTDEFEITYRVTIPRADPIYVDDTLVVLNSSEHVSPYVEGYGGIEGYILKYN